MRVECRGTRRGDFQLQPAQRHRAREQKVALREDQLLAQVDERQLPAVGEHGLDGSRLERLRRDARWQWSRGGRAHVACCGVI